MFSLPTYTVTATGQTTLTDTQTFTYDAMGNPTSYDGTTLTWEGKQLSGAGTTTFNYDENGLRTRKTVDGTVTDYYYNGSVLIGMVTGTGSTAVHQFFSYDASGNVVSMDYSSDGGSTFTTYYYLRNGQNDVVKLIDNSGDTVVEYIYDSWGRVVATSGTLATTLGADQPFRSRGYVYDAETGLYYVSSRYYDPKIGRWISPEPNVYNGEFDEGAGLLAYNVYAYCANNPVMFKDETGESITLACVLIGAGIGLIVGAVGGSHYAKHKKNLTPSDGWDYWKYVVGFGVAGGAVGALVGWGAGALIAKYGVATAATSITKGGGARFSSFNALKRSLGSAGKGKQWHHIVEQCQIGKSGFSKYWIQNSNNVINISNSVHTKISAYYSSIQSFTNGMTFRNWLAGQSFKTQYEWGIKVLRMFGVKI